MPVSDFVMAGRCLAVLTVSLAGCSPPPTYEEMPPRPVASGSTASSPLITPDEETVSSEAIIEDHAHHFEGSAHVHGKASLAATLEGGFVTVSLESPLDNFGIPESSKARQQTYEALADDLGVLLGDGACQEAERAANVHRAGDHAVLELSVVWDCRRPSGLDGFKTSLFEAFPGFETVNAIYIDEDSQSAKVLHADDTVLIFD